MVIKYAVYHRPKLGYRISGDAYLVKEYAGGLLVCLVDGLGSGPLAAQAAQVAVDWVTAHHQASLPQLVVDCHNAMHDTRGAVMALMRINTETGELAFIGVGNVEFRAWSAELIQPISYSGIVGSRLPSLREFRFACAPGDLFVLHSDGVSRRFALDGFVEQLGTASPQLLSEAIVADYAKRNDDVTLIVVSVAACADENESYNRFEVVHGQNTGS